MFLFSSQMGRVSWWCGILFMTARSYVRNSHTFIHDTTSFLKTIYDKNRTPIFQRPRFLEGILDGRFLWNAAMTIQWLSESFSDRIWMKQNWVEIWVGLNHPISSAASCPIVPQMHFAFCRRWMWLKWPLPNAHHQGILDICFVFGNLTLKDGPCKQRARKASFGHLSILLVFDIVVSLGQIEGPLLQNKILFLFSWQSKHLKINGLEDEFPFGILAMTQANC